MNRKRSARILPELPVNKKNREYYNLPPESFSLSGTCILGNHRDSHLLSSRINNKKDLNLNPDSAISAGMLNGAAIIYSSLIQMMYYCEESFDSFFSVLIENQNNNDKNEYYHLIKSGISEFPDIYIASGRKKIEEKFREVKNQSDQLYKILALALMNENPALIRIHDFFTFSDHETDEIKNRFSQKWLNKKEGIPKIKINGEERTVFEELKKPFLLHPHSLIQQLEYILKHWSQYIKDLDISLLTALDLINEDNKPGFAGPGPIEGISFDFDDTARFSLDSAWMPSLILLAKNALVWLDQLSRQYERPIFRLDEIPDEELDLIASRGFTGLWLIGLWTRSPASKRIKQLCGNPEAEASAYSLYDYNIDSMLGGWDALDSLKSRCMEKGIRLACDMVPNHTGIDSDWIRNHPDWFIQKNYSPFPQYTFTGENLSGDSKSGIFIEDKYYSKSDAAVVFKLDNYNTGESRYIYHGNDGTAMPWNDTAQIDFLNPEAREAVIQTILKVASHFSVIRFDAAMTLAKKHIQRLWHPEPGTGGAIPSRSSDSMTKEEFNLEVPVEFWREVVDRIGQEKPETLLLAEAFWMMEGYFVRNLGMHRVYNSAFMNMFRDEKNCEYREIIKNTLLHDPQILKRYVNFMNNPDEETAEAQFGKGDKYFGILSLMVTMPGLPMIGHGQIEGFTEKYGMEYRKAYKNENIDQAFVDRHNREIFPLMKIRNAFAHVEDFRFYDFIPGEGWVNENVFAYSNKNGSFRSLVIYNNSYDNASGHIRESVPFLDKPLNAENGEIKSNKLAEMMDLDNCEAAFCLMKEEKNRLWYIRNSKEIYEAGFFCQLGSYECQIYTGIHEVHDDEEGIYKALCDDLAGRGIADIHARIRQIRLKPVQERILTILNDKRIQRIKKQIINGKKSHFLNGKDNEIIIEQIELMRNRFFREGSPEKSLTQIEINLTSLASVFHSLNRLFTNRFCFRKIINENYEKLMQAFICWAFLDSLQQLFPEDTADKTSDRLASWEIFSLFPDYQLENICRHKNWFHSRSRQTSPGFHIDRLVKRDDIRKFMGIHRYNGILWFNKEGFESTIKYLTLIALIYNQQESSGIHRFLIKLRIQEFFLKWKKMSAKSEYKLETFLELLK